MATVESKLGGLVIQTPTASVVHPQMTPSSGAGSPNAVSLEASGYKADDPDVTFDWAAARAMEPVIHVDRVSSPPQLEVRADYQLSPYIEQARQSTFFDENLSPMNADSPAFTRFKKTKSYTIQSLKVNNLGYQTFRAEQAKRKSLTLV